MVRRHTQDGPQPPRDVPLFGNLIAELEAYLTQHPYADDRDTELWPGRIPGSRGDARDVDYDRRFDVSSLVRYYFKPALTKLGLIGFSWQNLRHFYASALLATHNYSLQQISGWMGHPSTRRRLICTDTWSTRLRTWTPSTH